MKNTYEADMKRIEENEVNQQAYVLYIGYKRVTCEVCGGSGTAYLCDGVDGPCSECDGRGSYRRKKEMAASLIKSDLEQEQMIAKLAGKHTNITLMPTRHGVAEARRLQALMPKTKSWLQEIQENIRKKEKEEDAEWDEIIPKTRVSPSFKRGTK